MAICEKRGLLQLQQHREEDDETSVCARVRVPSDRIVGTSILLFTGLLGHFGLLGLSQQPEILESKKIISMLISS